MRLIEAEPVRYGIVRTRLCTAPNVAEKYYHLIFLIIVLNVVSKGRYLEVLCILTKNNNKICDENVLFMLTFWQKQDIIGI